MAITINFNGTTLRKPGAYSKTTVNLTGGFPVAPAGIVGIVGEAAAGAPTADEDIRDNFFSPAQLAEVVEKYKEGPIVDAFRMLIAPSNDDRIVNGANRVYIYKTNQSTQATGTLPTAYGDLTSRNYGTDQNTISFQVEAAQAETVPAFAAFKFIPDENTASALDVRVNGGAAQAVAIPAASTPVDFVSAFNLAVTGVTAGGGTDRGLLGAGDVGSNITIAFTGQVATLTLATGAWDVTPTVGDVLYIPTGSVIAGGGSENVGGYVVTAATTTTITALKLADPTVAGTGVGPVAIAAITDVQAFAPVTLTYDATTPDGMGAAVELADGGAAVAFEELMYGGSDREVINNTRVIDGSTLAMAVDGANVTVTISSSFAGTPQVGDIMTILPGSILEGAGDANLGNYLVTAATGNTISATKFSGTPVAVTATDIVAEEDLEVFQGIISNSAAPISVVAAAEPKVTVALDRTSDEFSEDSLALGGNVALKIGYDGTTATVTVNAVNLTTAVAGGSGAALSIKLADYATIQQLADYINAQTGYSCEAGNNVIGALPPTVLDRVAAQGICETHAGALVGRIKKDSYEIQDFFDSSELVSLARTLYVGLPDAMTSPVFLAGAAKGGTTAAQVSAGIDEFQKVRINSLVPLFSRDATDDILDELTEPSSTYQISAVNAAAKSHCILMSDTRHRSERNAYCSVKDAWADSKDEATNLASARVALAVQDIKILKTDGTLDWVQPWGMACIGAGMQAGAPIGEPMTFKYINVAGIRHEDFDPVAEVDDAIDSGVLFAEQPDSGGFRVVVGNTTYGRDANFVYNRISVLYVADTVAYNLRQQLEAIFVGVSAAIADAPSIKNTVISILNTFRAAGLIVGDDTNDGTGFKNLSVTIEGNVAYVDVTITPAQGIDFILPTIQLDTIRQAA